MENDPFQLTEHGRTCVALCFISAAAAADAGGVVPK